MDLWKSVWANNATIVRTLYQFCTINAEQNSRITYVRNYIYGTQVGTSFLSMTANEKSMNRRNHH